MQIAEKWQNLFAFENPLDFQTFIQRLADNFLQKPEVMLQMAFDFYDCNNDGLISEFDLFKIVSFFEPTLYAQSIELDILTMLKLFKHLQPVSVLTNFRHAISKDPEFLVRKQKVMEPIYDDQTNDKLKVTK